MWRTRSLAGSHPDASVPTSARQRLTVDCGLSTIDSCAKRRGFSLADTIISAFILAGVMTLVFGTIETADRMFNQESLRQGLQSDLSRVTMDLRRDAAMTDFWQCTCQPRTVALSSGSVSRDGLAMVALSNTPRFEAGTNLPKWDRWVVYYATQEDTGRLIRQVINPDLPGQSLGAYAALATNLSDAPNLNADVEDSATLSESIRDLQASTVLTNGSLTVKVHLRRQGLKRANSNQAVVEDLESAITVRPRNTWPQI